MTARTKKVARLRPVVPDQVDFRDRLYQPGITTAPPPRYDATRLVPLPVLDQEDTAACTGFALANVVNFLLRRSKREARADVSPYMMFSMARRYDEFRGARAEFGSSLRGALKGWYRHGACQGALWRGLAMPPADRDPRRDWWQDAARRPMGAYYRVDPRAVTDMHVALLEAGVLYASAVCHAGWDEGFDLPAAARQGWLVPARKAAPADEGHAFVIVGYDAMGFRVLNSWGSSWGDRGFATLTYADWLDNAMDCWVAQLGVVTEQHEEIAAAMTLRTGARGRVTLAAESVLRDREIAPFVIDMENDGRLSRSGRFRTFEADLEALLDIQLPQARESWKIGKNASLDVAVYAHGGLTDERAAADTAAGWIPALYEAKIFPVFLMWETDVLSTLKNRLADAIHAEPRPAGSGRDLLLHWWMRRLEHAFAGPGRILWDEMKQNARAIGADPQSGARLLFALGRSRPRFAPERVRLHLIGHSAGSILHCHLGNALAGNGWQLASVQFMAPAVRVDEFRATLLPHLAARKITRYHQFHLTDTAEASDPTVRLLLGYNRSLLYLVSESFERDRPKNGKPGQGAPAPLLGMQKYFDAFARQSDFRKLRASVRAWTAPSAATASTTHGGFDDDATTLASIIASIRGHGAPGRGSKTGAG